jgi:S1-C subfamily serine protease
MSATKWICLGLVMAGVLAVAKGQAQQSQNSQSQSTSGQFRVVRSVSGTKGEERGSDFVMADPRTEFKFPEDKQVIVFFEWEGPLGMHKFQGTWRSPDGKAVSVSNFQYEANVSPFRGYWTLTLPEVVTPGLWVLEAQIDGQPAGAHPFRIQVDEGALPAKPLSEAEIYQRALGGMVFVDSLDAAGNRLNRGSGFFINPNLVLTAFENIDGASALQVQLPGGGQQKLMEVAGWNRSADWALLVLDAPNVKELPIAKAGVWKVGDVDYLLDAPAGGGRTIQPVEISGVKDEAGGGKRIYVSWAGDLQSVGSPLLDRQGQVVGILGGGPLAGMGSRANERSTFAKSTLLGGTRAAMMVVPISEVAPIPPGGKPVTLAMMASQGIFVPPIGHSTLVMAAYVCENYRVESNGIITGDNIHSEFSRKAGTAAVVVMWHPDKNQRTTEELRVYDSENHKVGSAPPKEIKLKRNETFYAAWKFSIASFRAGVYRVDILAGDEVQWRAYFFVTE